MRQFSFHLQWRDRWFHRSIWIFIDITNNGVDIKLCGWHSWLYIPRKVLRLAQVFQKDVDMACHKYLLHCILDFYGTPL